MEAHTPLTITTPITTLNKREKKALKKKNESLAKAALVANGETSEIFNPFKKKPTSIVFRADYREDWCERTNFEVCDAAKGPEKYADDKGNDYTHVYSYNKVMSLNDRKGISKILNRTNYRLLAWYFGPDKTRISGLKNFALIY